MKWYRANDIFLGEYGYSIAYTTGEQSIKDEIWMEGNGSDWCGSRDLNGAICSDIYEGGLCSGYYRSDATADDFHSLEPLDVVEVEQITMQSACCVDGQLWLHCFDESCYVIGDAGFNFEQPTVLNKAKIVHLDKMVEASWRKDERGCCLDQDLVAVNGWGCYVDVVFRARDEKDAIRKLTYLKDEIVSDIILRENDGLDDKPGDIKWLACKRVDGRPLEDAGEPQPLVIEEPANWKELAKLAGEEKAPACTSGSSAIENKRFEDYNSLLFELAHSEDECVCRRVVKIAGFLSCDDLLERLVDDKSWQPRWAIAAAAGEAGCADLLAKLADDKDWEVRKIVAEEAVALQHTGLLVKMACDDVCDVRSVVIKAVRHGKCSDTLEELGNSDNPDVREVVARSAIKAIHSNLLEKLAGDPASKVRKAIAEQGYALDRLANDENEQVRVAVVYAAGKAGRDDLLKKFSDDESELVHCALAESIRHLVRELLLDYKEVPDDLLEKLADDRHPQVRAAIADTAAKIGQFDLLDKLADDKAWEVCKIANDAIAKENRERMQRRKETCAAFRVKNGYDPNSVKAYMLAHPEKVAERTSKHGTRGVDVEFNGKNYFFPLSKVKSARLWEWEGCVA